MEADEGENAEHGNRRERIDHHYRCRGEPDDAERHTDVPGDLAEGRVPAHGETEEDDADGHHQQPDQQQGVEHPLIRLPQEHQRRLLVGGRAVGVVQIGEPGGDHVRDRTGGEHGETEDVQCTAEERGCGTRPAEAVEEREREWHP
jgi:hypothetical protein